MKILIESEFEEIFNKYKKMLINIANKYLRTTLDSEDVVQETFIKLYRTYRNFKSQEHLKHWLIRVTINNSLNMLKTRRTQINTKYINNLPDEVISDVKSDEIYNCILMLKDSYKTIIILYYYEKYDLKQIGNILNISESNASNRLQRAREKLKRILLERGIIK